MSKIGKKPIEILEGVKVESDGNNVKVSGPKGELKASFPPALNMEIAGKEILISVKQENPSNKIRALWGLYRSLVFNMVLGVSKGFEKKLEIEGVGYKAVVDGESLVLNVGFINPVRIKKPEGITFLVEKNVITVSGIDKEKVGQIAAIIRKAKKAEPYKGKGIKYQGEKIRRKEGKKIVAAKK
ncbi:MAG: 50S ribosomal protein L6 [Candidatus Staskawiczbacteria bacterium]|nr:50S ribosomal protein L6 [Candidatus Staskawiczbacteria bacterium]